MKIHFIGNTSTRARYECGVKGDGESETLEFDLAAVQDGFDLTACEACLLLAAKGESYGDKIALDAATDGERVRAAYTLPAKVTVLGAVSAQLLFETGEASWRTRQFDLDFSPAVEWSEKIAEGYPDALERIEATADEAKATAEETAELVGTFDGRITVLEGDVESLLGKDFSNLTETIHEIEESAKTETAERKAGDEALKEALEAETEARKEADEDLTTAIVGESEARETADAALDARLTTLENTSFDGLADAVHSNTEMAREALSTANKARDDLTQEIADRESACEALQGALADATAALDKSIGDAETRLTDALNATESELQKAIDDEAKARESADEALTASIASEAKEREEADEALRGELTASIESEAAERKSADEALTAAIESEANERKAADAELSAAIEEAKSEAVEEAKEYADGVSLDITETADTYVFTFKLTNGGKELSTASIDLPLEEMIISGHYDAASKQIVLILRTGESISFSVADLVEGLVNDGDLDEAVAGLEAKIASALADAESRADEAASAAASEAESAAKAYADEGLAGKQDKLTAAGSATNPVYIDGDGKPAACFEGIDLALGDGASVNLAGETYGCIAIGHNATTSGDGGCTAIGDGATASGLTSTAMGREATASGTQSYSFGYGSTASGNGAVAIGRTPTASGAYSVAIGYGASARARETIAIGLSVTAANEGDIVLGSGTKGAANKGVWLNAGLMTETDELATKAEADALDVRLTDAEKDIEDLKAGVKVDLSDYYTKEQTDALIAARMSLDDVDAIFE